MTLPILVALVDDLFRSVVTEPGRWNEAAFGDWMESATAAASAPTKDEAKALRRSVRVAMKLAAFWSSPATDGHAKEDNWKTRVDVAMGPPAWRPTLDLATTALEADPSPELYDHVAERFRLVTNQPFGGGMGYQEWLAVWRGGERP